MPTLTPEQRSWVERAAPRVTTIARSVRRLLPQAPIDELESAGYEGLVQAALRYDPESGIAFAAFAHYRIRGAMIDWARAQSPGARRYQRAVRAMETTQSLLRAAGASSAGDRRALEERVMAARALVEQAAVSVVTSRAVIGDPEGLAAEDDPERALLDRELRVRIEEELLKLDPEERELVDALYRRGESMHEVAQRLGTAPSTVSRRHQRAMSRLADALRR
jgi:RNA polymerase sigma factor for flagellar operon FliA